MIKIFDFNAYVLLDPGANLSFVTPLLVIKFSLSPKIFREPFSVYTLVGEFVVAHGVYRGCPIFMLHKVFSCDLIELEIFDFDVILGMDWLHASYASIDCRTRKVRFQLLEEPVLEWKGSDSVIKG